MASGSILLTFDSGTLVVSGAPGEQLAALPGVRHDPRADRYRAEARLYRPIVEHLRRKMAAEIADVLVNHADSQLACQKLIEEANRQGGKDNVTVIVSRFDMPASATDGLPMPATSAVAPSTPY